MVEIFILCEYPALNGGERSMLATLDGVRKSGFTPVVLAPPAGPLADTIAVENIELLPFSCISTDGVRFPLNRLRDELAAILHRRRPAILHANSLAMGRLSGPVVDDAGIAGIGHIRDIVKLSAQAAADLNRHRRLLAVSHATRDFHVARGLSPDKTHVLYNGVDLDLFQPQPPTCYLHHELGLQPDCELIGAIGQISLRKGQDVLLRAALQIADRRPSAHWLIVGRRHGEKDETRQFENNLHDMLGPSPAGRVHFLGTRDDVPRLLNELTILVHPARQEPLGRVLLESAACGVPVIAANSGGTPEIFPPETYTAILVPPNDDHALARAMLNLLNDPALCKTLAAAARRRAVEQFNVRLATRKLLEHYRELL